MKKTGKMFLWVVFTGVIIVLLENMLCTKMNKQELKNMQITDAAFRADFFSEDILENKNEYSEACKTFLSNVEKEVSYFPVAESSVDKAFKTSYVNTWMSCSISVQWTGRRMSG